MHRVAATVALWTVLAVPAWAVDGNLLPLNSGGDNGSSAELDNNGYAGTYIQVADSGDGGSLVNLTLNAHRQLGGSGAVPHVNIAVADSKFGFTLDNTTAEDRSTGDFWLPAGTHFVRVERDTPNNPTSSSQVALVNSLNATDNVSFSNLDTNGNALAAADTYIEHYRQGSAKLALSGVAPGTEVNVKLSRHAFNFGANFRGTTVTANPGTNQQDVNFYLQNPAHVEFFADHFNMAVPSNAGKWSTNEGTRDQSAASGMAAADAIMNFADANGIRNRMHNLIWGPSYNHGGNPNGSNNQQPNWAYMMMQSPNSNDGGSGILNSVALRTEISERIDYYIGDSDGNPNDGDRASRYTEVDIFNESWHTGSDNNTTATSYWDIYGASGISSIYEEAAAAVAAAGSNAKLYVNEYNILQNGPDSYGNWFRNHIEDIQNAVGSPADGPVEGVGMQYYALPGHSTAYMQKVLQNMSATGLQLTLTEFGVQEQNTGEGSGVVTLAEEQAAAAILNESLRMMFGTPQAAGFLIWGWGNGSHTGNLQRNSALVNSSNWTTLTLPGEEWEDALGIADHDGDLTDGWMTQVTATVGPDGTIDFTGFYGDYEITIGGVTYDLSLVKGDTLQSIVVAPGDYNGDHIVDAADYTVWRNALATPGDLRADGNGDEIVDEGDYGVWAQLYGTVYPMGGGGLATVPEPAGAMLLGIGVFVSTFCKRRRI